MALMSVTCEVSHDEMSVEEKNVEKQKSGGKWDMCCIKNNLTVIKHMCVTEHMIHGGNFRRVPCRYILFLPLSNVVQKINKIVNKKSFDEKITTIKQLITSIECSCAFKQV